MSTIQSGFTSREFLPNCCDPGGLFSKPVYETFSTLIDRANQWLRANRKWKVTTCESVEFKYKSGEIDFNKMTYLEYGEVSTRYIRGLRLWLTELEYESDKEQQIGYLNLIPQQVGESGMFKSPSFETLDAVIGKYNSTVQFRPPPGRIITVESQEMKMKSLWGASQLDPDRSYWVERGDTSTQFLFIIRIFFELTAANPEHIGITHFIPAKLASGGFFSSPQYEPFSTVVSKASDWCAQQVGISFCHAQSIEIKKKSGREVDPQIMGYIEHGNRRTSYVRLLRVVYTRPAANLYPDIKPLAIGRLVCKTFVPLQVTQSFFSPKYEDLGSVKEKVSAWVKATGARVLSAETSAMRMRTGGEATYGTEATYTYNQADRNEYWIFVIRLYINAL